MDYDFHSLFQMFLRLNLLNEQNLLIFMQKFKDKKL